jgi:CysZ protein
VPALVALLLLVLFSLLLLRGAFGWVNGHFPPGEGGVLELLARWTLRVVALLASVGVSLLASLTLASPLSSAALDGLVRVHARALGLPEAPHVPWAEGAGRALASALVGVAVGAPFALLVAAVNFVFPAATVVTGPLAALVSGYVVAWNLLDYPLGVRGVTLAERGRWMLARPALITGFASSAALLLFVPGLGLLLLPAGVVGAEMVVERAGEFRRALPGDPR